MSCGAGICSACWGWWQRKPWTPPPPSQAEPRRSRRQAPVVLHVYTLGADDVAKAVGEFSMAVHAGAFHAAVEVYGDEWSYGLAPAGDRGIYRSFPKCSPGHTYRESIDLGITVLAPHEVSGLLREMSKQWIGEDYDMIRHNCCHFCDEFCKSLGVGPIPAWVNKLASTAKAIDDMAHKAEEVAEATMTRAMSRARENSQKFSENFMEAVRAKAEEVQQAASEVTRFPANALNSMSSSAPATQNSASQGATRGLGRLWPANQDQDAPPMPRPVGEQALWQGGDAGRHHLEFDINHLIRMTFEDRAHEFRGSFEATAREWQTKADQLDRQFKMCFRKPELAMEEQQEVCVV